MALAPEKDDLTEHQYEIYQKTHNYEHPLDEERAKIGREKGSYARRRRQSEERLKRRLNEIARPDDADAWEEDPHGWRRTSAPRAICATPTPTSAG